MYLWGVVTIGEGGMEGGDVFGGACSLLSVLQEFLNDYGMVWVGSEGEPGRQEGEKEEEERANREEGLWIPQTSLAGAPSFQVDFNLILKNVKVTAHTSSLYHRSILPPPPRHCM